MDRYYNEVLNIAGGGYWEWNIKTETGYFSPEFKTILGYKPDELNDVMTFSKYLIHPDDLPTITKNYQNHILTKGQKSYSEEVRYFHKSGKTIWTLCSALTVKWNKEGNPEILAGYLIDITEKKENEITLSKVKSFLSDATNTAIIGSWELDLTTGSVYWDHTTKKIHGVDVNYKPSLNTGLHFYKVGRSRDLITQAVSLAIQNGTSFDLELELKTATGQTIEVRSIGHADFKDGQCLRIHGAIQDIDKQSKIKKQLGIQEEQFDGIFKHTATGMAIINTQGQYLRTNNRFCDMLGYTSEELHTLNIMDVTHPDDIANDKNRLVNLLDGKAKSFNIEKRYIHKEGHIIWADLTVTIVRDATGAPLHFLGQAVDISKNKKNSEELLRVNQELEAILNSGTEVAIISTNLDGIITHFSKGAENLLGYKAEELVGLFPPAIIHDKEETIEHAKNLSLYFGEKIDGYDTFIAFAKRGLHEEKEWTYVKKDGTKFPVQVSVTAIKNNKNKNVGYLGIAVNISKIKNAEKELEQAIDIVSEQNKRLLNFTYIVSHNLRTHAANFELGFNLLNDETSSIDEKLDIIHQLKTVSDKLSETIHNLSEVVAIQSNINKQRKKINLHQYIQNTLTILTGEIDLHQVTIENNISKALDINYNPAYLDSILLNFLTNAIKYRDKDRKPHILLSSTNGDDNTLVLHIKDNGKGIDLNRYQKDLFGMYKTFHRNSDAKGIGLFITKNQVEAMGGKIEVHSEVGVGTTFSIHLTESRILGK